MFKSTSFTAAEQVSLSPELALVGIQSTPLTSLLLSKGSIEKAMSTVYSWREVKLDETDDITFAEGSETTVFQESVRRQLNNILQIFKKAVSISGTAEAMQTQQFTKEISDRLLELKINLEKTLINGTKDDGSVTGIRKLGGLIEQSGTKAEGSMADAVTALKEGMQTLWGKNLVEGEFYALVNADVKETIDNAYVGNYNYQHKETNFGLVVDSINTNYGVVNLVLSKHVPVDGIVLFNESYVDLVALREAQFEPLAKTGDSVKGQVVAEYSLKVGSPDGVVSITLK